MGNERLILFARTPRLGRVKTRLVPPLSESDALDLYRALLTDSIELAFSVTAHRDFVLALDVPWSPTPDDLGGRLPDTITTQGEGDLGGRLLRAVRGSHRRGATSTIVIGSDSPTLPPERIEQAFALLRQGAPAVMGPSDDGGYVLIGVREPHGELFEKIPWGGAEVAEETRKRAAAAGIALAEVAPWYDVDDARSLSRLRAELRQATGPGRAPATARCLALVDAR